MPPRCSRIPTGSKGPLDLLQDAFRPEVGRCLSSCAAWASPGSTSQEVREGMHLYRLETATSGAPPPPPSGCTQHPRAIVRRVRTAR